MFSKYFTNAVDSLIKAPKTAKMSEKKGKGKLKDGKKKREGKVSVDIDALKENLNKITQTKFIIDSCKMIDPSGYSPDDVDLIAYKELYKDIKGMMEGFIPCELVYGTYHVSPMLNKENLMEMQRKIVQAKKVNRYTERENQPVMIPAFLIAYDAGMNLADIKTVLIDNYMLMSTDHASEVDIIVILNKGIIIKNWRDKRSYIALETGKDTLMWFFILMNEYLDVEKDNEFDPRNYVKHAEKYNEY
jgi:hypothetical protein